MNGYIILIIASIIVICIISLICKNKVHNTEINHKSSKEYFNKQNEILENAIRDLSEIIYIFFNTSKDEEWSVISKKLYQINEYYYGENHNTISMLNRSVLDHRFDHKFVSNDAQKHDNNDFIKKVVEAKEQKIIELTRQLELNKTIMKQSKEALELRKHSLDSYNVQISLREQELNTRISKIDEHTEKKKKEYLDFTKKISEKIKHDKDLIDAAKSNLIVIPYMSAIIADFATLDFEQLAQTLDWGENKERAKKVASIREIRAEAKERIEAAKNAEYQLKYLLALYPELEEIIETEYSELNITDLEHLPEHDKVKDFLTKEEYAQLSSTEKNQLALDRYVNGHRKSNWQIGRDYELYIGYVYERKGYTVEYFGSVMKLEDLGRDLIVHKNDEIEIVQCKYWSQEKLIREKHITQLFGTAVCYCIEHNLPRSKVKPVLITNTDVSDTAKEFAEYLGVQIRTHIPLGNFPRIKCNIGKNGEKIYHLPFDLQYDATKIDKPGEFMAMTVKEAEDQGFRRSFKWHGNDSG